MLEIKLTVFRIPPRLAETLAGIFQSMIDMLGGDSIVEIKPVPQEVIDESA